AIDARLFDIITTLRISKHNINSTGRAATRQFCRSSCVTLLSVLKLKCAEFLELLFELGNDLSCSHCAQTKNWPDLGHQDSWRLMPPDVGGQARTLIPKTAKNNSERTANNNSKVHKKWDK